MDKHGSDIKNSTIVDLDHVRFRRAQYGYNLSRVVTLIGKLHDDLMPFQHIDAVNLLLSQLSESLMQLSDASDEHSV